MKHKRKFICRMICALALSAPLAVKAQSEQSFVLDTLHLPGTMNVVEPELLKKGVVNNALDALNGQTAGVNVTSNGLDRMPCSTLCVCVAPRLSWAATIRWLLSMG